MTPAGKAVDKHSSLDPAAIVGDISASPPHSSARKVICMGSLQSSVRKITLGLTEIVVPALIKPICALKSKPTEDQGTPPARQKCKHGAHGLKGNNKQLTPHRPQTAQEITSWKDFSFCFLQLCLEQFSHPLPSAGCYLPYDACWKGPEELPLCVSPEPAGLAGAAAVG